MARRERRRGARPPPSRQREPRRRRARSGRAGPRRAVVLAWMPRPARGEASVVPGHSGGAEVPRNRIETMQMTGAEGSSGISSIDWTQVWEGVPDFFMRAALTLLSILGIILGAMLLAWIMRRVIDRIVGRIVRGAKSKANVDDTQALDRSPIAQVRLVQRTRTLGSILSNIVNVTIVIVAIILIVYQINADI